MKSYLKYSDLVRGETTSDYEMVGKVSAESVSKHTGKNWKQWVSVLEKAGARSWTYQEIVAFLKKKHRLTPWWQQGVALGFEIATGRRKVGQDAKGKYMITATKTLPCDVKKLWAFLTSDAGMKFWLKPLSKVTIQPKVQFETDDGFFGEVRTMAKQRRVRLLWQDPLWEKHTFLEIWVLPRPASKSMIVFNHTGILESKTKDLLRERWRGAIDQISKALS